MLQSIAVVDAVPFASSCHTTARRLAGLPAAVGHDLAGQVFNRLVADRKFLAAYYTSIPAATLLAGLALDPKRWPEIDWSNVDHIRDLVVVDPACGTGTLLMAAYQRIVKNNRDSADHRDRAESADLHQVLVENVVHGADVVDSAIHMTASTLAAMMPEARFDSMNVHVFPLGVEEGKARIGSLEWLDSQSALPLYSGAAQRITGQGTISVEAVPRPRADLVIANPPFRRHNSNTGEDGAKSRVFGHAGFDEPKLGERLSEVLKPTPGNQSGGLATAFTVLADKIIAGTGRLAFVLPATFLSGTNWRGIRRELANRYDVEYVVSVHDPSTPSLSFDTSIAECLIVARKLAGREHPSKKARFVNLWWRPQLETEALALERRIRNAAASVHRIDGPPVGGTPILTGNDKWGEIVEAPIGSEPWTGSRWKHSSLAQHAFGLAQGSIWDSTGSTVVAGLPIGRLGELASLSAYHLQVKGTTGAFEISEGWNRSVQWPALWHVDSKVQRSIALDPDAALVPKPDRPYQAAWEGRGALQLAPDVRYTSQRIDAAITSTNALGVGSWLTVQLREEDEVRRMFGESCLALWFNSSLGILCHANHANRSQLGRGRGNKTMLRTLPVLDPRQLTDERLSAADDLYQEMKDTDMKPFYMCAVDDARITLDNRFLREVLGLGEGAVETVRTTRELLAQEPSIHGTKQPMLPD